VDITQEAVREGLAQARYITTPRVETVLYLALVLEKPLLVEGPAGAGKTELAKVAASMLGTELIRLQCYEGLDEAHALYEWNYQKQLLRLQVDREKATPWEEVAGHVFSRDYLLERPLLRAIVAARRVVLLIDEVDKADEEFEAFLLEVLSDYQVSVPELGTIRAVERPVVVLTSNQRRELSEALKRRCLHLYLEFPGVEKEREIIALKVPDLDERLRAKVAEFVAGLRRLDLRKAPSIAETLDWARALVALRIRELDAEAVRRTLAVLLKYEEDVKKAEPKVKALTAPRR
jgi:MoxR-like ATPase